MPVSSGSREVNCPCSPSTICGGTSGQSTAEMQCKRPQSAATFQKPTDMLLILVLGRDRNQRGTMYWESQVTHHCHVGTAWCQEKSHPSTAGLKPRHQIASTHKVSAQTCCISYQKLVTLKHNDDDILGAQSFFQIRKFYLYDGKLTTQQCLPAYTCRQMQPMLEVRLCSQKRWEAATDAGLCHSANTPQLSNSLPCSIRKTRCWFLN